MNDTPTSTSDEQAPIESSELNANQNLTEQPEKSNEPPVSEELLEFISYLPKALSRTEIAGVFAMPSGLFVSEENVSALCSAFEKFEQEVSKTSPLSPEKRIRKLFATKTPELYYLLVGKNCLSGFLVRCPLNAPQKYSLPVFKGEALPATSLLHPKDPKLTELPGIDVEMGRNGLSITLQKGEKQIAITSASLSKFASLVREAPRLEAEFPAINRSQRDALIVLARALKESKRPGRNDKIFVPQKLKNDSRIELLRWKSFIFCIASNGELLNVYGQRGRHFGDLLFEELSNLRKQPKTAKLRLFEFPKREEKGLCGFVRLENELFKLPSYVFRSFADLAFRSRSLQKNIPSKFSVADILNEFAQLVQKSSWVMEHDVPRRISEQSRGKNNYRTVKGWYFIVDKQSTIRSCHAPDEDERRGRGLQPKRDRKSDVGRQPSTYRRLT